MHSCKKLVPSDLEHFDDASSPRKMKLIKSTSQRKSLPKFPQRKMKIFNWMQGYQFAHHVTSSNLSLNEVVDGSSGHTRRSRSPKAKAERDPLLEQEVQAAESWDFEGILTIGTLAISPLNTITLEYEDNEKNDPEVKQSYINNDDPDYNNNETSLQDPHCDEIAMCKWHTNEQRDVATRYTKDIIEVIDEEIAIEKPVKMGKRVTLLDLLLADGLEEKVGGEVKPADDNVEGEDESTKVMKMTAKKAIFYSKLSPDLGGTKGFSSKAKKLQRFMTRMVKKKIHPDMEARLLKKAQGKLNDDVRMGIDGPAEFSNAIAANESASLLPIHQGIMV